MESKKKQIKSLIENKNVPNILYHGPYLGGKEELCKYFISCVYPNQNDYNKYVLWINCLYTNGIQYMKQHIKLFAQQIMHNEPHLQFKTIILQYAEHLTYDSQYCLRRTIEQYNRHTRFIILCENKHKLLQPICSRFVQIYVNVYQSCKKSFHLYDTFRYHKYNTIMKTYDEIKEGVLPFSHISLLARQFYEQQFFALELLDKHKNHERFQEVVFRFEEYRKEFKNEILCILYILNVFRNKSKIQIFSIV